MIPIRNLRIVLVSIASMVVLPTIRANDFSSDASAATTGLRLAQEKAAKLLRDGDLDASNQILFAVYPESTRTAAQAFVLGNLLFGLDPKESYKLHQAAAEALPNEPYVALEWAMEQHRAREYAGAAKFYEVFLNAYPNRAVFHGLHAECLLRQGKLREACDAWDRSEKATSGTLIDFERTLCEINGGFTPFRDRSVLRNRISDGDLQAAEELVLLNSKFETDWWNSGVNSEFLEIDIKLIEQMKAPENTSDVNEIVAAAKLVLSSEKSPEALLNSLKTHGLVLDDEHSLPRRDGLVSLVLGLVERAELMPRSDMQSLWEEEIRKRAEAAKSAELFNILAHFYLKTERLPEIQQHAWELTGDERFGAFLMLSLDADGALKLNDERLQKAVDQFPENNVIATAVLNCTAREGKPLKDALVRAIKAEYSELSFGSRFLQVRPSAKTLRYYFSLLTKELKTEKEN